MEDEVEVDVVVVVAVERVAAGEDPEEELEVTGTEEVVGAMALEPKTKGLGVVDEVEGVMEGIVEMAGDEAVVTVGAEETVVVVTLVMTGDAEEKTVPDGR
jgi:hypothetical protein